MQLGIQDFPEEGALTQKGGRQPIIWPFFPENCMKMKKFWARGGRASLAPPLDPPLQCATEMRFLTLSVTDFGHAAPPPPRVEFFFSIYEVFKAIRTIELVPHTKIIRSVPTVQTDSVVYKRRASLSSESRNSVVLFRRFILLHN